MKYSIITLIFLFTHSALQSCSFAPIAFCETINEANPNNIIVRGYFSDELSNGLIFNRLETLKGDEDREVIKIWDNVPFDCNGLHLRPASFMGNINEEIIVSLTTIDTIYFEGETIGDYRVPEGLWWETHFLKVLGDSVVGNMFNPSYHNETLHYDDFIENVIENSQCLISSSKNQIEDQINIYPTLVNDYITIEHKFLDQNCKLIVFNDVGQQVVNKNLAPTINLGTLPDGMYIIMVQTPDNKCYHKKIIKI